MIKYFKMKRQEWALKSMFYGVVLKLIAEQEDVINIAQNVYEMMKNTTGEEFKDKMIDSLAVIVHEENKKNKEQ